MNIKLSRLGNGLADQAIPVQYREFIYTWNGFPQRVEILYKGVTRCAIDGTAIVPAYFGLTHMVMDVRVDYLFTVDEWLRLNNA